MLPLLQPDSRYLGQHSSLTWVLESSLQPCVPAVASSEILFGNFTHLFADATSACLGWILYQKLPHQRHGADLVEAPWATTASAPIRSSGGRTGWQGGEQEKNRIFSCIRCCRVLGCSSLYNLCHPHGGQAAYSSSRGPRYDDGERIALGFLGNECRP